MFIHFINYPAYSEEIENLEIFSVSFFKFVIHERNCEENISVILNRKVVVKKGVLSTCSKSPFWEKREKSIVLKLFNGE